MVDKKISINWEDKAKVQFADACRYIRKDSPKNSLKVKKEIIEAVGKLELQPKKHPPDKYKQNNNGQYRAFELHHYRVTYRVLSSEIKILTLRHTSMEPHEY